MGVFPVGGFADDFPDAVVGTPYVVNKTVGGSLPYSLLDLVNVPAWMTIILVADVIEFRGTPGPGDASAVDIVIGYKVEGPCGTYNQQFIILVLT